MKLFKTILVSAFVLFLFTAARNRPAQVSVMGTNGVIPLAINSDGGISMTGSSVDVTNPVDVASMPVVDVSGSSVDVTNPVAVASMPVVDVSGSTIAVTNTPDVTVQNTTFDSNVTNEPNVNVNETTFDSNVTNEPNVNVNETTFDSNVTNEPSVNMQDGSGDDIESDEGAMYTISFPHARIHAGWTFTVCRIESVADDADLNFTMLTHPTKEPHMTFKASSGGESLAYVYEGNTTTGVAVAITPLNKKRSSANVDSALLHVGKTNLTLGAEIACAFLPGGTKQQAVGSSAATRDEWILDTNMLYYFAITNVAGSAKTLGIELEWYYED